MICSDLKDFQGEFVVLRMIFTSFQCFSVSSIKEHNKTW